MFHVFIHSAFVKTRQIGSAQNKTKKKVQSSLPCVRYSSHSVMQARCAEELGDATARKKKGTTRSPRRPRIRVNRSGDSDQARNARSYYEFDEFQRHMIPKLTHTHNGSFTVSQHKLLSSAQTQMMYSLGTRMHTEKSARQPHDSMVSPRK